MFKKNTGRTTKKKKILASDNSDSDLIEEGGRSCLRRAFEGTGQGVKIEGSPSAGTRLTTSIIHFIVVIILDHKGNLEGDKEYHSVTDLRKQEIF